MDRQVASADVGIELADRFDPFAVDRERYHFEFHAAETRLQAVQRRHFLPAWATPGRPDVEQHNLALEIADILRASLIILEPDRRDRLRLRMQDEVRRRLLRRGKWRNREDQPCGCRPYAQEARHRSDHSRCSLRTKGSTVSCRSLAVSGPICL